MELYEIAGIARVHVCNLSSLSITKAREAGLITRGQEKELLADLKKADGIWENPVPGVVNANRLW